VGRRVVFYRAASGECPVEGFLDGLASSAAQKVTWVLRLIEDERLVPARYLKRLTGTEGIWECRVDHGSNTYRILAFMAPGDVMVLTHGFGKKSQKIPRHEIRRAEAIRSEYLSRRQQSE
jgi:phage-related protein